MSSNNDWREMELQECLDLIIDHRGKTPKKLGGDWSTTGYRALSAKNVKTGYLVNPEDIRYVDEDMYTKWMKDEIKKEDVLITSEGPLGEVFFWDSNEKIVLSQRLFAVRLNKSLIYPRYFYAYASSTFFQNELANRATGTTVLGIRQSELLKTKVLLPPMIEQVQIGDLIYFLNKKIELNNNINKNLEEMTQALFKRWFVDFEFPNENGEPYKSSGGELVNSELGLIPKDWELAFLGQVIKVKHGYAFKSEYFSEEQTNRILLTPGNFKVGGGFSDKKLKYYSNEADVPPDYILKKGDMLITMTDLSKSGDTLGFPAVLPNIPGSEILHNQRLGRVIFCTSLPIKGYIYNVLCSRQYRGYILGSATGSTVKHTAPNRIEKYKTILPNEKLLVKFDGIMAEVFNLLSLNYSEINRLSLLRDSLLSKLLSGDIRLTLENEKTQSFYSTIAAESKEQYSII